MHQPQRRTGGLLGDRDGEVLQQRDAEIQLLGAVLLDLATALASREGADQLIIYATESSHGYYRARFGERVLSDEPFKGADEETYFRLLARLKT